MDSEWWTLPISDAVLCVLHNCRISFISAECLPLLPCLHEMFFQASLARTAAVVALGAGPSDAAKPVAVQPVSLKSALDAKMNKPLAGIGSVFKYLRRTLQTVCTRFCQILQPRLESGLCSTTCGEQTQTLADPALPLDSSATVGIRPVFYYLRRTNTDFGEPGYSRRFFSYGWNLVCVPVPTENEHRHWRTRLCHLILQLMLEAGPCSTTYRERTPTLARPGVVRVG